MRNFTPKHRLPRHRWTWDGGIMLAVYAFMFIQNISIPSIHNLHDDWVFQALKTDHSKNIITQAQIHDFSSNLQYRISSVFSHVFVSATSTFAFITVALSATPILQLMGATTGAPAMPDLPGERPAPARPSSPIRFALWIALGLAVLVGGFEYRNRANEIEQDIGDTMAMLAYPQYDPALFTPPPSDRGPIAHPRPRDGNGIDLQLARRLFHDFLELAAVEAVALLGATVCFVVFIGLAYRRLTPDPAKA